MSLSAVEEDGGARVAKLALAAAGVVVAQQEIVLGKEIGEVSKW